MGFRCGVTSEFVEWQAASQGIQADVAAYGAFRSAAEGYTTVDTEGSTAVENQL